MLIRVILILLFVMVCVALAEEELEDEETQLSWDSFLKMLRSNTHSIFRSNLPYFLRQFLSANISETCQNGMMRYILSLSKWKETWPVRMADACGKFPGGVLEGTVMDFGSFDECIKIRVNDTSDTTREAFRGRYCMVGYHSPLVAPLNKITSDGKTYVEAYGDPPKWIHDILARADGYLKRVAFWFGTCVPSACSAEDIQKIISILAKPLGVKVAVTGCQVDKPTEWTSHAIGSVSFMGLIACICAFGTLLDVLQRCCRCCRPSETENAILRSFKAFSLYTNMEKLFGTTNTGNLTCFSGIRFLSATWIVLGHTYFYTDTWKYLKYRHLLGVEEQFNGFLPLAVIENFTIPVGSFFFMSGFLLVYTTWNRLEKNGGRINFLTFFIHKYWRMTPAMGLTMVMFLIMPLIDSGPLWTTTLDPPIKVCRKYWWANYLYFQNWWNNDDYCLIHTWYLAALMQYHIVGIILLVLAFRWPKVAILIGSILSISCTAIVAVLTVWHDYPMPAPGLVKDMDVIEDYTSRIYIKSFAHISTYFIGMIVAYLVLKYKNRKISPRYQALGWTLATISALSSVYGLYGPSEEVGVRAFYIVGHRIGWALSLGWVTYACATGIGGVVNRILSWHVLFPLGQLSYLIYLIHPLVIIYRNASLRERVYYGQTELVFAFLANVMVSIFLAFVGYVTVEAPFAVLEGIVFKSRNTSVNLKRTESTEESAVSTRSIKSLNP